ncbi:MAG TPA: threonine synthase [Chitinophagaceae bacterium]|nr:threonine synthase [Chitinophagaceae bacterium]
MQFYSTNKQSPSVSFKEATIKGQAPDKGLYFPEYIPQLEAEFIKNIEQYSNEEIAYRVIAPYVGEEMSEETLRRIVSETVNFPIPLVPVTDSISSLELFHGPTLAFKDIGARFMSRCLREAIGGGGSGQAILNGQTTSANRITVLVATSGDTGGAVANGFYGVEGVEVVILYPSGKVSPVQEKQLTTLGGNIKALEVQGTFDDCQAMVKQAFMDQELTSQRFLTSANSINVARWLPQQFYYFFAYKQWKEKGQPPVFSVPSGNFGNICAGMLAMQSGLPVSHFIAACNVNDIVSDYLRTQELIPKKAVPTLSNAMDVGNPSNFVRILEIFGNRFPDLKERLTSYSITDTETEATIKRIWEKTGYLADPHGAVGYLALERYLLAHEGQKGIFLETAHPVKFPESVERITGQPIPIPEAVSAIMQQEKKSTLIGPDYEALKSYLLD